MSLILASRLDGVQESATLKMSAAAKELTAKGVQVLNLTTGEPDFVVLPEVKQAAHAAIDGDFSKYTVVPGILELRQAIAKKLKTENQLEYAPDEVVVTAGAKQAIFNFLLAVISPGDEVIMQSPYWVSYPEMVKLAGGVPVIIPTDASTNFKITKEQLQFALTPKTKAFLFNSPSNPTGMVYSKKEMLEIAEVLANSNVWIMADDIYEKIMYEEKFTSLASLSSDAFNRTLTVNGFSKSFAMTGWRLGYAAGPKRLIQAMSMIQGQSTSNACSIVQKAGLAALALPQNALAPMVETFRKRRDRMAEIFSTYSDVSFVLPQGAFYFFLCVESVLGRMYNHDQVIAGSEDLAFYGMNSAHVATVAGKGFGADNYLRLSYATKNQEVEAAAQKLIEAFAKLK